MNTAFGIFILLLCIKEYVMGSDCTQLTKTSVNCYNRGISQVPQDLTKSVEIMNLAFNRIRKLRIYSFQRYTKLRVLKLYDNTILYIEDGTFEPLSDLEEIDLSTNALRTLPLDLFNLPSLRNLYLDSNMLIDLQKDLMNLEKPISAPLEYLNVADCSLDDIPDLGLLPKLTHLNASSNPLSKISFDRFSSMCALESIDFTKTEIPFCECQEIAELASIYFPKTLSDRLNFCDNKKQQKMCPDATLLDKMVASPEYQKCNYTSTHPPIKKRTWIIIGCCVAAVIVLVLTVIYQIRKRRQKKLRRRQKLAATTVKDPFMYNNNGTNAQEAESDRNELTSSPS